MQYRIIKLNLFGYTVEVLFCAACELPEGAEDTGKTEIRVEGKEVYTCYSCLMKMTQQQDKKEVIPCITERFS